VSCARGKQVAHRNYSNIHNRRVSREFVGRLVPTAGAKKPPCLIQEQEEVSRTISMLFSSRKVLIMARDTFSAPADLLGCDDW